VQEFGPLQLLILQASPFCNINCKYCYLPDRSATRKMSAAVVEAAVRFVLDANLVKDRFTVVWHAGEPLTVPTSFYRAAVDLIGGVVGARSEVTYSVQTNATTIDHEWCDFLKEHRFHVGVSIDGPEFIHDANRVTRSGQGTFARTMRGVRLLREYDIEFHVIAVLTNASLQHADELFEFFRGIGVSRLGFNIEEAEGPHRSSSITRESEADYIRFMRRFGELCRASDPPGSIGVRELVNMESCIRGNANGTGRTRGQECTPFSIVSVDSQGNVSTFSPELMGNTGKAYSGFVFGNVLRDRFEDVVNGPAFQAAARDIRAGVELCERACGYFAVCGGGAPSNKYYENGTLASTETLHCRYKIQLVAEQVLGEIKASLGTPAEATT
jgi:uncharacterized protein